MKSTDEAYMLRDAQPMLLFVDSGSSVHPRDSGERGEFKGEHAITVSEPENHGRMLQDSSGTRGELDFAWFWT